MAPPHSDMQPEPVSSSQVSVSTQGSPTAKDAVSIHTDRETSSLANDDSTEWKPNKQQWLIIAGQTCVTFVVGLDSTILTVSLPTVAKALGANTVKASWIVAAYLLASAVVQPLTAAFADIFGRRGTFFTSLLLFTVGTIICCTAHSVGQMLAGRIVQGIGGGGILNVNLIILSDFIPLRYRSKYIGLVQLVVALAINLGPIIGGLLVETTWRWIFYINFPFCAIGLFSIPLLLRYVKANTTTYDKLGQIDWIGSSLFTVGAGSFLVGISWGGNEFKWDTAATLVPIIVGVATVCGCLAYERYGASTPLLRLSLFQTKSAVAAYLCTVLQGLTLFATSYILNLYLITVKLYSPAVSGTFFLTYGATVIPVSGITGQYITKLGCYKWAIFCGWLVTTFGLGSLMILGPDTYVPGMAFVFLIAGTGQGLLFIAHQVAAQATCKAKEAAHAAAMFSFMRSFGFCLGVVIGTNVFQNFLRQRLAQLGLSASIAADAEGFAPILRAMAASTEKDAIIAAYTWAFRYTWATMAGISGLGFFLSFVIGEHTLDVKHDSTHKLMSKEMLQTEFKENNGPSVNESPV